MALFDFLKTVGKKLFSHEEQPVQTESTSNSNVMAEEKIKSYLDSLNLGLNDVAVKLDGDKVTLKGAANSQETLEKAILAVGNVEGIAKVDAQLTAPDAAKSKFYTVKSGDTLSQISKEMYGNANLYNKIFEANRPLLKNADDIYPGQQLRIPAKENIAA